MIAAPLSIFLLGCLHEDIAIVTAGYFVVERGLSPWLAGLLSFGGLLVNNVFLYYLGMLLRDNPWMQRWLLHKHGIVIRRHLERHMVKTLSLARLGHGMLTPALIGCGSLGIPMRRIFPALALTGAAYVAVMLTIVIVVGATMLRTLGYWAWLVPGILAVAVTVWIIRSRLERRGA